MLDGLPGESGGHQSMRRVRLNQPIALLAVAETLLSHRNFLINRGVNIGV